LTPEKVSIVGAHLNSARFNNVESHFEFGKHFTASGSDPHIHDVSLFTLFSLHLAGAWQRSEDAHFALLFESHWLSASQTVPPQLHLSAFVFEPSRCSHIVTNGMSLQLASPLVASTSQYSPRWQTTFLATSPHWHFLLCTVIPSEAHAGRGVVVVAIA
jgi:hypothetical protein